MNRTEARQILGLEPGADSVALDRAYKRRARSLHPDAGGSAAEFEQLQEARRILSTPAAASNVFIVKKRPWLLRKWKNWRRAPRVE